MQSFEHDLEKAKEQVLGWKAAVISITSDEKVKYFPTDYVTMW